VSNLKDEQLSDQRLVTAVLNGDHYVYQTNASFRTLKDSRAVLLTLSMRFGNAVKDQR